MEEEQEYQYELKIPKERIAVLIGKKGETKRVIERTTKTKLKVSRNGKESMRLNR